MLFEKNYFEKNLLSEFLVHTESIVKFSVRGQKNQIIEKSESFIMADFDNCKTQNHYLRS